MLTTYPPQGHMGFNPIQRAIIHKNSECSKHLINKNADLNVKTHENETLLELARNRGNEEAVDILNKTINNSQ